MVQTDSTNKHPIHQQEINKPLFTESMFVLKNVDGNNNSPLLTESMVGLEKVDGNNPFLDNYKGLLNKNKIEKRP